MIIKFVGAYNRIETRVTIKDIIDKETEKIVEESNDIKNKVFKILKNK